MLQGLVLVLNRSFIPVDVTSVQRAFCMLYRDIARAVDVEYQTFDFHSWCRRSSHIQDEVIGLVGRSIHIPRVVVLLHYDHFPKRNIRFSRQNIFLRDNFTCQYCARKFPRSHLNLDHVVPRAQGGETTWDNIVTSCHPCNRRKGGLRPEEAGILLMRKPYRPFAFPFFHTRFGIKLHDQWKPFVSVVDSG
ncbi:MAG: HNH endonuclease [Deltaproteobacteria bacterium RIFCSPLOWO2_02_FULL_44_10]|nr:MAG: HNH endonuclease [Deltaproteobacteria bacterium RIFCSPHIGHO2_02_FULL_44_16]OGQ47654.1 MAG: HNH endonuclease [Deltaproteobacteria bacterium RIFCSPLOWO2_02_FULL_44_10]